MRRRPGHSAAPVSRPAAPFADLDCTDVSSQAAAQVMADGSYLWATPYHCAVGARP